MTARLSIIPTVAAVYDRRRSGSETSPTVIDRRYSGNNIHPAAKFLIVSAEKFWNFTLRLQYRFEPYPGMESDDDLFTNTGYLLFITKHDVWPRTLEVQGKNDFEMSLAMGGNESTYTFDDAARIRARKPAGQWNSVEIVSKDGQLWTYLNGTPITHVTKHPFTEAGYVGFQVESGPVHWRNIRIKADN